MGLKAIVALLLLTGVPSRQQDSGQSHMCLDENVCVTKECIVRANEINNNADFTVNPCDDFYQFTCGNFIRDREIPKVYGYLDYFVLASEHLFTAGKVLVESEPKDTDFPTDSLVRDHYAACMNESMLETLGTRPLEDLLDAVGGWPVLMDNWSDQDFSWYNYDIKSNEVGLKTGNILSMHVYEDKNNVQGIVSWNKIHFLNPVLGLHQSNLLNGLSEPQVQYYYDLMVDLAKFLGADEQRAMVEMQEVLQFEMDLASCSLPSDGLDSSYQSVKLGDYQSPPGFPASLKDFINDMFNAVGVTGISVDDNEHVGLVNPGYLIKVSELLQNTTDRVVANYLGWRVVLDNLRYTNNAAKDILTPYTKKSRGITNFFPKWKQCFNKLHHPGFGRFSEKALAGALTSMYARNYLNNEDRAEVVDMFHSIKQAYKDIMTGTNWMEAGVKAKAIEKLDNMGEVIAYPEELLNQDKMTNLYSGLGLSKDTYLNNLRNLEKFWKKKDYESLRERVVPNHWTNQQRMTIPYFDYSTSNNYLKLPLGVLQNILFNSKAPKYANYGAMGNSIAYQISHGFDKNGKKYGPSGNVAPWWDDATENAFDTQAVCMDQQYGNYFVEQVQLNVNGTNTLLVNVADNGGIKIAYNGYADYVSQHGEELTLPGIAFTSKQLFWISYGQSMCQLEQDAYIKTQVLYGGTPPNKIRVNGALKNNLNFARDFNCPAGSTMNPTDKCAVW